MKKIILFLILAVCSMTMAVTDTNTVSATTQNGIASMYWTCTTGFSDANVCVAKNYYGSLTNIIIYATGTEARFDIVLSVNPYEGGLNGKQQVYQLVTLKTWSALAALSWYQYALEIADSSSNVYGGRIIAGDIYIGRKNMANTATALFVYLYGDCSTIKIDPN